MKTTSETLLSFAESELIHKESIRAAVLRKKPQRAVVWTRVLLPVAACLVLLCGAVFAIPSARAEVLRWFRGGDPAEYLAVAPEDRTPVPALDELIVPPAQTDAPSASPNMTIAEGPAPVVADLPLGSVTDNRILSVCDEPIWRQIAESFSIELGETMFDGSNLYLSVICHGLSALPDTVRYVGGSATATRIPDEGLSEYFEDGKVPDAYSQENVSEWESSDARYFLLLSDETEVPVGMANLLSSSPDMNPHFSRFMDTLPPTHNPATDAEQAAISEAVIRWLPETSLRGVIRAPLSGFGGYALKGDEMIPYTDALEYLLDRADENGVLTAKLLYRTGPLGAYLTAELGTVQIDLRAWERLERQSLAADGQSAVCGPQKVLLSRTEWIETAYDETTVAVTNTECELEGTTFTPSGAGYLDGLGVHDLRVDVTLPEGLSDGDCEAFFENLHFYALIDGEYYSLNSSASDPHGRTVSYLLSATRVPYDRIESVGTVRIVPFLFRITELRVGDERIPLVPNERLAVPDTTDRSVSWEGVDAELIFGILTFTKQP